MATSVALQPHQIRRAAAALVGIKAIHTLAWFSIESCMIYLLYAGLRKRSERRAAFAPAVVGAAIFFAGWFAQKLPAIHVPLLLLAAFLHLRNLRIDRSA